MNLEAGFRRDPAGPIPTDSEPALVEQIRDEIRPPGR